MAPVFGILEVLPSSLVATSLTTNPTSPIPLTLTVGLVQSGDGRAGSDGNELRQHVQRITQAPKGHCQIKCIYDTISVTYIVRLYINRVNSGACG